MLKRILLHVSILVLLAAGLAGTIYVAEHEGRPFWSDAVADYNSEYNVCYYDLMDYVEASWAYLEHYQKLDTVIVKNDTYGDIRVRDLALNYNAKVDSEIEVESTLATYRKKLKAAKKKEDQAAAKYYQAVLDANDSFFVCMDSIVGEDYELVNAYDAQAKMTSEEISEQLQNNSEETLEKLWREVYGNPTTGLDWYVVYEVADKEYVIANVGESTDINEENNADIVTWEPKTGFVYDTKYQNGKAFINHALGQGDKVVAKAVKSIRLGVHREQNPGRHTMAYYLAQLDNAQPDENAKNIEDRLVAYGVAGGILCLVMLILFIMLLVWAGHHKKGDAAQANLFDKAWLDVIVFVAGSILVLAMVEVFEGGHSLNNHMVFVAIAVFLVVMAEGWLQLSESFMRRIKTKTFWHTTLTGTVCMLLWKVLKWLWRKVKRVIAAFRERTALTVKICIAGVVVLVWQWFLIMAVDIDYNGDPFIFISFFVTCAVMVLVWIYMNEQRKIRESAERISQGKIYEQVEYECKFTENKKLKDSINQMQQGLSLAVEQSVRDEKMRTELITNVSHDLKTPLTSIINYVDLMKKEGAGGPNTEKYLDILDKKSYRLKNLTEDLVEYSKISSGVLEMNLEKIELTTLVRQSLGEYEEKFAQRALQNIVHVPEHNVYVQADGRRTWRVFENIYQNIFKYAMQHTRVFVEMQETDTAVQVLVKNVSAQVLDVSGEELMERFVRGDASRNTEGSGLGLSIAKTIMDNQNGSMEIDTSGDLFTVILELQK